MVYCWPSCLMPKPVAKRLIVDTSNASCSIILVLHMTKGNNTPSPSKSKPLDKPRKQALSRFRLLLY